MGMFGALSTIGKSLATTTSGLVAHKYGDRAGEIVTHATDVVGDTANRVDKIL